MTLKYITSRIYVTRPVLLAQTSAAIKIYNPAVCLSWSKTTINYQLSLQAQYCPQWLYTTLLPIHGGFARVHHDLELCLSRSYTTVCLYWHYTSHLRAHTIHPDSHVDQQAIYYELKLHRNLFEILVRDAYFLCLSLFAF